MQAPSALETISMLENILSEIFLDWAFLSDNHFLSSAIDDEAVCQIFASEIF